jgi:hypothetical protein
MIKLRKILLAGLLVSIGIGLASGADRTALAAGPAEPAISADASSALAQMGKTLGATAFSFQARTIRVYSDASNQSLHIEHTFKVTVRRPDRLLVDGVGDDGATKVMYDGKTLVVVLVDQKQYVSIPVPDTLQGMLQVAVGHFDMDFPLGDFIIDAADKAFLTGITAGQEVDTATIDGVPCRHLVFMQPPGIQLELWVEKNDQSLPRRLIVTYRSLPGQPIFVADMSDWNFSVHPADADFVYQPQEGVVRQDLTPQTAVAAPGAKP